MMIFLEAGRSVSHLTYIISPSFIRLLSVSIAGSPGHRWHPYSLENSMPVAYQSPIGCFGPGDESNHRRKAGGGRPIALAGTLGASWKDWKVHTCSCTISAQHAHELAGWAIGSSGSDLALHPAGDSEPMAAEDNTLSACGPLLGLLGSSLPLDPGTGNFGYLNI